MIYAFTGKKQSGKNTAVRIWQLLDIWNKNRGKVGLNNAFVEEQEFVFSPQKYGHGFQDILNNSSNWQLKSFAHKLKQICAILTNTETEDWDKEEFKKSSSSIIKEYFLHKVNIYYTNRELLQYIGTDLFRKLDNEIWINALFRSYKTDFQWLIDAVRFENEALAIRGKGGKIIRIIKTSENLIKDACEYADNTMKAWIRKNEIDIPLYIRDENGDILNPQWENKWNETYDAFINHNQRPISDTHISEIEQDSIEADYTVIANEGDTEHLMKQIKSIMIEEKVINTLKK